MIHAMTKSVVGSVSACPDQSTNVPWNKAANESRVLAKVEYLVIIVGYFLLFLYKKMSICFYEELEHYPRSSSNTRQRVLGSPFMCAV